MKVLSIKQPWAWLIIHGGKDIENRTWRTKYRGKFLVHASMCFDEVAALNYNHLLPSELHVGGIIGEVEIVDCVDKSDSKWFDGPRGFVLKNPKPLPFKKMKGRLGFFNE